MFDSKSFLKKLTTRPGVYQMFDKQGKIIYVGKAKNLKKRVSSYFKKNQNNPKTHLLVQQIAEIDIIVTNTENEALILEHNLIKQYHPKYNISLRDDKSYPYILISNDPFPRIDYYRGIKKDKGRYFGPYPNASSVHETINLIQKVFNIRQCQNSFFSARTRPCLQYQIKRCSAPCVNTISQTEYLINVYHAELFLEGKNEKVIEELTKRMEDASEKLNYELAAQYRNQIQQLRNIQASQFVESDKGDVDVVTIQEKFGIYCISLLMIRQGRILGHKIIFPNVPQETILSEVLEAFISQYYFDDFNNIPKEIILNQKIEDQKTLASVLSEKAGVIVKIKDNVKGDRAQWIKLALLNGEETLNSHMSETTNLYHQFLDIQKVLSLEGLPKRLECFDISHTMGEATVASCVVFTLEGPSKNDYRRFNIEGITGGDDFAAMYQALKRRYSRFIQGEGVLPDILVIDGGKGQLKQAEKVLSELGIEGVLILGVAKGEGRKPGLETIFISGSSEPLSIAADRPAFFLLQAIRDEAHRFAITTHRQKRRKARNRSVLEDIPGIGAKRRSDLLKYFGGLQGILNAAIEDIEKVDGVNHELAERIYYYLHKK